VTAVAGSTVERRATRWGLFVAIAVAVVIVDQLTKSWLVANVEPGGAIAIVGDWLRLIHGRNDGGLFGLFGGSAAVLAIASLGVIGLIVAYHARSKPNVVLSIALGLLLGGAIGNLIDRIRYGYVVDFVDAGIGTLRFYTFNVADSAISIAIFLLILLALFPALGGAGSDPSDG
jgi:signal peptidase II